MALTWGKLQEQLVQEAKLRRIPIVGQFELTSRCNLKCKMCYLCKSVNDSTALNFEYSADEWIRLAEEARDAGMLYLLLTGGEVFLRQDFRKIYEAISRMGLSIKIYTNATMITPEIAKWLGVIPPSQVCITIYGASPETYAKVCGNADGFERALKGVDLLIAEGIALQLRMTLIRDNINDFDKVVGLAKKRGVPLGIVDYVSPRREGNETCPEEERLSPEEFVNFEEYLNKLSEKSIELISEDKQYNNCSIEAKTIKKFSEDMLYYEGKDPFYCNAGKSSFWVTWDGKMTPCADIGDPCTYPLQHSFKIAWEEIKNLCSTIPSCSECNKCLLKEYCMFCPARLKIETGFFDRPAQYLCEMARIRKEKQIP